MTTPTVRRARPDDVGDVAALAGDTWPDRAFEDYLPETFPEWVAPGAGREDRRTVVATTGGRVVGVCGCALLTDEEAWLRGLRVAPERRGEGVGTGMARDLLGWARGRGATVARAMVFSWNPAGLGWSLSAGFEARAAFRFLDPAPDPDAAFDPAADLDEGPTRSEDGPVTADRVVADPAVARRYWVDADARSVLSGLALDTDRAWALSELDGPRIERLADDQRVLAVVRDGPTGRRSGVRGFAVRVGVRERGDERVADYGVAAWDDVDAARALFDAVRGDAAAAGADGTRVLLPETPRHVAEAARVRASPADEPHFVTAADLTGGLPVPKL